jgi:hypothetical protein
MHVVVDAHHPDPDPAVLGQAELGDVEGGHGLEGGGEGSLVALG